jgi:hypothetical protein
MAKYAYKQAIYYKVGGAAAAGDYVLLQLVRDATMTDEKDAEETTVWGSDVKTYAPGMADMACEGQLLRDESNATWQAMRDAYQDGAVLGIKFLDRTDDSTGEGRVVDMHVVRFQDQGGRNNLIETDFRLVPALTATAPSYQEAS